MPITSSDIKLPISGGASNSSQNAALGGALSTTTEASSSLFDSVGSAEALSGDTEYRCFYVKNNHGSLTAQNVKVFLSANTPSAETDLAIGLGTAAIGATEQSVADENTAPNGVTFVAAASQAAALVIGDLAPGLAKAVWLRRVVNANAAATNDTANVRVTCDTAA